MKPLNENLRAVRVETEEGDLIPIMDAAGAKFSELIRAVTDNNKAGKLTLKIDVKPSTAGTLAIKAECTITKPKGMPAESLLWPTPDGNLMAEDPRQTKLDLKPIATEPARELKTVG
ncbi:MAG TPA: hypothetical protein P5318_19135 [Candidatus Hydrogenedentes bacterium]|nr:hypothetical protein [Candidatus Hydrogenedentota bacterium]